MDSGDEEQFEDGEELTITLQPKGGAVKSIGDARVAGLTTTDMDINAWCIFAVHGYLSGPNTDPASLIVIRYDLSSHSAGRVFKGFRPTLTLRRHPPNDHPSDDPWVEDLMEPGYPGAVFISEKFYKKSKKSTFSPSIAVLAPPPVPISANLGFSVENTADWVAIDRYTVHGGRRPQETSGARENCNIAYWNAKQDDKVITGIDVIQVAFLICRKINKKAKAGEPREPDFKITFGLDADVDLKYDTGNTWKKFKGVKHMESHIFRPSKGSKKIPQGVDKDYLGRLETGEGREVFRKLAWVHDIELRKPAYFYPAIPNADSKIPQPIVDEEKAGEVFEDARTSQQTS